MEEVNNSMKMSVVAIGILVLIIGLFVLDSGTKWAEITGGVAAVFGVILGAAGATWKRSSKLVPRA